ncbi:hypothetical protein [Nonomuraea africana]|uniref:DNA-binding transcriptional MocR family regulator n=1 Tax=Nonomuraea africana TaxID=46171 RepID=A0ABR9KEM0_9ACTN|nr:hypothetical protein [Nonomuraea africana]MBE1560450.1 DNA-binding transcriptional MocR family regulator [Nonomuraea africana]
MVQAKQKADLYTETLGQLILADLITTHAYDRHTRAARLRYRRRRELLLDRIAAIPSLTPHGVPAGLHTLITLPSDGPTEQQLLTSCAHHGLALRGLTELICASRTARSRCWRFRFSVTSEPSLAADVKALLGPEAIAL